MKFSELLNDNITIQKAFLLWMIYEWPIFSNNYNFLIAYNSYNPWGGSRSKISLKKSWKTKDEYYLEHLKKLQKFLNTKNVYINKDLKEKIKEPTRSILWWVSILIENDIKALDDIDDELYLYWLIEKWLIDAESKYKNMFLLWAMDARGSLDFTWNFLAIDIAQRDTPEITKRKLNKFNDLIWAIFNYNPRLTQEKSNKKNDQFRLDLKYYMGNYWLFTPFKIDYYKNERPNYIEYKKEEVFFIDKNYQNISLWIKNKDRNIKINELAIWLAKKDITPEEKQKIIYEYKMKNLTIDDDDEIEYSSQNMKEFAKQQSDFMCEFNREHRTFISKSKQQQYVEAHHLIPFSERKNFDVSIDIVENIVCLCPNCHRKIHLAIDEDKIELIRPLLNNKIKDLHKMWVNITEDKLFSFYKIETKTNQLQY